MKPCASAYSALLCPGPIQNSLSHFIPPLPTTQRLRTSAQLFILSLLNRRNIRIAAFQLLNGLRSRPKGWRLAHFAPHFSQNPGHLRKFDRLDSSRRQKMYYVYMTAGQEEN